jgi:hypothetical protein
MIWRRNDCEFSQLWNRFWWFFRQVLCQSNPTKCEGEVFWGYVIQCPSPEQEHLPRVRVRITKIDERRNRLVSAIHVLKWESFWPQVSLEPKTNYHWLKKYQFQWSATTKLSNDRNTSNLASWRWRLHSAGSSQARQSVELNLIQSYEKVHISWYRRLRRLSQTDTLPKRSSGSAMEPRKELRNVMNFQLRRVIQYILTVTTSDVMYWVATIKRWCRMRSKFPAKFVLAWRVYRIHNSHTMIRNSRVY